MGLFLTDTHPGMLSVTHTRTQKQHGNTHKIKLCEQIILVVITEDNHTGSHTLPIQPPTELMLDWTCRGAKSPHLVGDLPKI